MASWRKTPQRGNRLPDFILGPPTNDQEMDHLDAYSEADSNKSKAIYLLR